VVLVEYYQDMSVSQRKEGTLSVRMEELGVKEEDLLETFIRASGPGAEGKQNILLCVSHACSDRAFGKMSAGALPGTEPVFCETHTA